MLQLSKMWFYLWHLPQVLVAIINYSNQVTSSLSFQ